jgi:acylphosphatase
MPTIHLLIKGNVQGVFYRATAKKVAENLKITGWIKNTNDGNVEAIVTGEEEKLEQFLNWCKTGPQNATVVKVITTQEKETHYNAFEIIRLPTKMMCN